MYKELLTLIKTKNKEKELIIPFKSKFFGDGTEWLYSGKEELRKLLWLEELKSFTYKELGYFVMPELYNDTEGNDVWKCDVISIYITEREDDNIFYTSYEKALLTGLIWVCKRLIKLENG